MHTVRKPIVIVGSVTMDLVTRATRIPRPGETLIGTAFETTPGGKGANQAVAAARLGYPVAMVGMVGNDAYGPALLDNLARMGVDTSAMTQVEGSSGLAPMFVAENGENSIVVVPGANGKMDRATIDRHANMIRSAGIVLCQLEIPLDTLTYTLSFCAHANIPVMLDPAPAAALPEAVFRQIEWFTPNETEAAFYVGGAAPVEETAQRLLAKGLRGVALKRVYSHSWRQGRVGEAVRSRGYRHRGRRRLLQRSLCRSPDRGQRSLGRGAFRQCCRGHRRHPQGRASLHANARRCGSFSVGSRNICVQGRQGCKLRLRDTINLSVILSDPGVVNPNPMPLSTSIPRNLLL